jgi:hypothetical protein
LPVVLDDGTRKYVYGLGLAYTVDANGGAVQVSHTKGNAVKSSQPEEMAMTRKEPTTQG